MKDVMRLESNSINVDDFNDDVAVRDLMRQAYAREQRALVQRQKFQRACMWETIMAATAFAQAVSFSHRKAAAMQTLKTTMMPMVMRKVAARAKAKRSKFLTSNLPPRPSVDLVRRAMNIPDEQQFTSFVKECIDSMDCIACDDREVIVRLGDTVSDLYIVAAGVVTDDGAGSGRRLQPGDVFGSVHPAIVPYPSSLFARGDGVVLWRLPQQRFTDHLTRSKLAALQQRMRQALIAANCECIPKHFPVTRALIARTPILRDLPIDDVVGAAKNFEAVAFEEGRVLYSADAPACASPHVFLAVSGEIGLVRRVLTESGTVVDSESPVRCGTIAPGQRFDNALLGYVPHILSQGHDATCVVRSDVLKCWKIPAAAFIRLLLSNPIAMVQLREDTVAARSAFVPRPTKVTLSSCSAFSHMPPHRVERLCSRFQCESTTADTVVVQPQTTIVNLAVVVSGTIEHCTTSANGKLAQRFEHTCVATQPSSWVLIGAEFEILGLVDTWRDKWRTLTVCDLWRLPVRDVRVEYTQLTVEHQQKTLLAARKAMMRTLGLPTLPRARVQTADKTPKPPDARSQRPVPPTRDAGPDDRRQSGLVRRDSSLRRAGDWVSSTTAPAVESRARDGSAARAAIADREAAYERALRRDETTYVSVGDVSANAKSILQELTRLNITGHRLEDAPRVPAPRRPHSDSIDRVDLAALTTQQLDAYAHGGDVELASNLVTLPEVNQPMQRHPRPTQSARRRHKWPSPPRGGSARGGVGRIVHGFLQNTASEQREHDGLGAPAVPVNVVHLAAERSNKRYANALISDVVRDFQRAL